MTVTLLQIFSLFAAFICGIVICWLIMRSKLNLIINNEKAEISSALQLSEQKCEKLKEYSLKAHKNLKKFEQHNLHYIEKNKALTAEAAIAQQLKLHLQEKQQDIEALKQQLADIEKQHTNAQTTIAELMTAQKHMQKSADEKLALLNDSKDELKQQFTHLANDIFDEKDKKQAQHNKARLDAILEPFNKQLNEFKTKVEQIYHNDGQKHASLITEIKNLRELNQQLNKEAINLTTALKGDNQMQGTWGELILEKVLQKSGLRKGHEFDIQASFSNQQKTLRPDVIVHLPHNHDIIIDSKVSLIDYEKYISAASEHKKQQALKQHISAVKKHVKNLSDKDYSNIKDINTLDFVLMFMPIEAAFTAAFDHNEQLLNEAFNRKIIIVTPTTLLATLKTIENLWRFEKQNIHARAIADKAGNIYDKLRGFVEDIEKLGKQLDSTHKTYHDAMNKLTLGKGNLINQAQQLLDLGVKVKKEIPKTLLQQSEIDKS